MPRMTGELTDEFTGIVGGEPDDPVLEMDARGRLSLGAAAGEYRRFVATVTDGQILLTPAVVVSARHPLADALADAVNDETRRFLALDARGRLNLNALAQGRRHYQVTAQDAGRILLTPCTIVAADHPLWEKVTQAREHPGEHRQRRPRPTGT